MSRFFESGNRGHETSSQDAAKYEILTNSEQRTLLFSRIRDLVRETKGKYEGIVFLDKSARPIAHLYREIWQKENGNTDGIPATAFLNVGTENYSGYKRGDNRIAERFASEVSAEDLETLRRGYKNLGRLDEKSRVLIVDDIRVSGESLKAAKYIMHETFPNLIFDTRYLSSPDLGQDLTLDKLFVDEGIVKAPWSQRKKHGEKTKDMTGYTGVLDSDSLIAKPIPKVDSPESAELRRRANQMRKELDSLVEEEYQKLENRQQSEE